MITFNQLAPNHQRIIEELCEILSTVLGAHLKAILLKGSILKPDEFIPDYSDLDLHVYVSPELLIQQAGGLNLEWALKVQQAIGHLKPLEYGFSQFQLNFMNADGYPEDWIPPTPAQYIVVWGEYSTHELPFIEQIKQIAIDSLKSTRKWKEAQLTSFLDKPDHLLYRNVRLTGTYLKGAVWNLAQAVWEDPNEVWTQPLSLILARLSETIFPELADKSNSPLVKFFEGVRDWDRVKSDSDYARLIFRYAIETAEAIEQWLGKIEIYGKTTGGNVGTA